MRLVKGDEFISKCLAERPPEKVRNTSDQEYVPWFSIVKDNKTDLNNYFPCQVAAGGSGGRQVTEEEVRRVMSQAIVRQVGSSFHNVSSYCRTGRSRKISPSSYVK